MSESICLHHGTDLASAQDICQNGLDQAKAAQYNISGEFWATTSHTHAVAYAIANPAGGTPACFEFEIPEEILHTLLTQLPIAVLDHGSGLYEFLPGSFSLLNQHMTNKQVISPP